MAEIFFNDENFQEEVLKSDKPVLVDFYADWCGPCKMLGPILEDLTKEYEGKWKIGKCNVDDSPEITMQYGIQSIPTILFIKDGQVVDKTFGFQSKDALKAKLDVNS